AVMVAVTQWQWLSRTGGTHVVAFVASAQSASASTRRARPSSVVPDAARGPPPCSEPGSLHHPTLRHLNGQARPPRVGGWSRFPQLWSAYRDSGEPTGGSRPAAPASPPRLYPLSVAGCRLSLFPMGRRRRAFCQPARLPLAL